MRADISISKRSRYSTIIRILFRTLPVSVQPKILTLKNRYLSGLRSIAPSDLFAVGVTIILILSLYLAVKSSLNDLSAATGTILLSGQPLNLIIKRVLQLLSISLFLLIAISSAVTGIHELFLTYDLERLLSSPIRRSALLAGKALSVLFSTSWMIVVFSVAPLVALGVHLKAGILYYLCTPLLGFLYLTLAVQIGLISSIILATILPARGARALLSLVFIGAIITLLSFAITPSDTTKQKLLLIVNQSLSADTTALGMITTSKLLPSTWVASAMTALLEGSQILTKLLSITLLLSAANAIAWGGLLLTFKGIYSIAHNKLYSSSLAIKGDQLNCRPTKLLRRYIPSTLRSFFAIALKELYTFSRDITHLVQLAIFLTISLLYFINFQQISTPKHVSAAFLRAWDLVTVSSFILLSSLIILSICARFVFPSLSLEGNSLWLIQVAPITVREIVRAKLITWLVPTGIICSVLFASAGLALALDPVWIVTLAVYGVITAYGLVGLAMRLGARFARFDWEHRGELTSSFGSLIYLILGLIAVISILTPLLVVLGVYIFLPASFNSAGSLAVLITLGVTGGAIIAWLSARQRCELW
jgi:ABC-2 type transport system permease protein